MKTKKETTEKKRGSEQHLKRRGCFQIKWIRPLL